MRCDHCDEEIKYEVIYLELPCYASTHRLAFCDDYCLTEWVDEHTSIDALEDDYDD